MNRVSVESKTTSPEILERAQYVGNLGSKKLVQSPEVKPVTSHETIPSSSRAPNRATRVEGGDEKDAATKVTRFLNLPCVFLAPAATLARQTRTVDRQQDRHHRSLASFYFNRTNCIVCENHETYFSFVFGRFCAQFCAASASGIPRRKVRLILFARARRRQPSAFQFSSLMCCTVNNKI